MGWSAEAPEPRRNDDGQMLCSTTRCKQVATHQVEVTCTGCVGFLDAATGRASVAAAEIAGTELAAQDLIDAVRLEERPPTDEERQQLAELLAPLPELRQVEAHARRQVLTVTGPHTHPVFGCDRHPVEPAGQATTAGGES